MNSGKSGKKKFLQICEGLLEKIHIFSNSNCQDIVGNKKSTICKWVFFLFHSGKQIQTLENCRKNENSITKITFLK